MTQSAHQPLIRERRRFSYVWIVPIITLLVGLWLMVKTQSEKGPEITISFQTAGGIEAGKTRIKYKSVEIGRVTEVRFSEDYDHIVVSAEFSKDAAGFLKRDTQFWVVKPRLGVRGVSGLDTLVSGAYIEIEPGPGAVRHHFVGLEAPPVIRKSDAGRKFVLLTERLGSLDAGSPVYYQGIPAGEVTGYELANDHKSIYVHVFIKSPMDELIQSNTRFWNVSGMDISLGADGLQMRTESMQTLMFGGIAFETPVQSEPQLQSLDSLIFTLYKTYDEIAENEFTRKMRFVIFFDGSVRGLNPGAPVEFKGIKIGSVQDIKLEFNNDDASFRIPVIIEIEPERIISRNADTDIKTREILAQLIDQGLRAQLATGSLLTGQLFVQLDILPETDALLSGVEHELQEIPTTAGGLEAITASLQAFASKLEKVEIDKIAAELEGALAGANKLVNAPEVKSSVVNLKDSLAELKSVLAKLDGENINDAVSAAKVVLQNSQTTVGLLNNTLQPDSPLQYSVIQMVSELEETARAIRSLVNMLERHPQALILGRGQTGAQP